MSTAHKEQEIFKKQVNEVQLEIQKQEQDRQLQISKISDMVDRKRRL
jgi:hypothetical protein